MIVLNSSSHTLQATLGGGISTTALDITVVYFDRIPAQTVSEPRYASQETKISSATVTTIANAPGEGIARNIVNIFGFNADVTSATLAYNKLAGAVSTGIKKHTLTTGQTLTYEHSQGWSVL